MGKRQIQSLLKKKTNQQNQQKTTTTILITKKQSRRRHLPGRKSFEGFGGQHPDPEAISLPVRRRHFRRRHIRFSQTTPMYRGGVCDAIASGFSVDAKSRSSSSSSSSSLSSNNAFFTSP